MDLIDTSTLRFIFWSLIVVVGCVVIVLIYITYKNKGGVPEPDEVKEKGAGVILNIPEDPEKIKQEKDKKIKFN
ncbi:MAG: hypothetical protein HUU43_07855 [Ignavibacteriaceae bacterium]|nr:hypothetical protein [Ignavibacteriaceae bacterium]NUM70747.1 hypothetical protein [Ignavibacteriaceae bacterium]